MEKLINLYKQWAGEEPADVIKLAGQGSNRQYFRIIKQDGDTVIGVIGTSRDEDHAFVYLANHFNLRQLPVPKILAVSDDELCYIQTDLGGTSLFDAIKGGREAGGSCLTSSCVVHVGWIGPTAILSRSLMWTVCSSISTISSIVS